MESQKLREIRDNLYMLPVLREKFNKLNRKIREAEGKVKELLQQYEKECLDVEQLQNSSLSTVLLKWVGKYEDKLEKENQEIVSAKMEYDKAVVRVKELSFAREETENRISALELEKRKYDAEINSREEKILNQLNNDKSMEYKQLIEEQDTLGRQRVEMEEAIRAANRVKSTVQNAIKHLDSAERWATYDVWTKGGIFSHMAKYNHIDQAESDFNRLSSQLQELKKELSDIQNFSDPEMDGIDSTTRTVDLWFDNIFTDLKVRNRIRNNADQMRKLYGNIDRTITHLEKNKAKMKKQHEEIETRKNELLISM